MERNDPQLVRQALSGDTHAAARLYDAYARRIYDYLYYRCHHRETAEDLASQTFLKALEKLGSFDQEKGSFSAWLHRIARNALIDHFRATKPADDIEDVFDRLRSGDDPSRDAETAERLRAVEKRVAELPSAQREVVLLRVWDELSYAEIAAITGKSEAACKMSFSRAMSGVREDRELTS
jgi:RNA polymerase sigma factor (sigma-70 family)